MHITYKYKVADFDMWFHIHTVHLLLYDYVEHFIQKLINMLASCNVSKKILLVKSSTTFELFMSYSSAK